MVLKLPPRPPQLPSFLRRLTNEEFKPLPHTPQQRTVIAKLRATKDDAPARLSLPSADYWSGRQGTAAALIELNEAYGRFYNVRPEAAVDKDAADAALGRDQLVIDVQTHFIADRSPMKEWTDALIELAGPVAGDRFRGLGKLIKDQNMAGYSLGEHLRRIYMESDTNIAVLSSAPGDESDVPYWNGHSPAEMRMVNNAEMVGVRELIERLGGTGRLLNHSVVHPNIDGELYKMDRWKEWCKPVGWKVYTGYGSEGGTIFKKDDVRPWSLDDDRNGTPFLHRAMDTGVRMISAHKGLSSGADTSWNGSFSPKDVGPSAKAFPEITFLIYHSGYEPRDGDQEEGPYTEETTNYGVNRLIKSLKDNGIGAGGNVYAEIGALWYMVSAHPQEAAHVMGKLLTHLGEDNIVWGTDCVFFGSPQPLIETFRAFEIPEEYQQKYGYPAFTETAKSKILGLNAARIYGIDPDQAYASTRNDDLAWVKAAIAEWQAKGTPTHA